MGARLNVEVFGTPAPQGSKRYVGKSKRTGRAILVESSEKVKPWRERVLAAALVEARRVRWVAPEGPVLLRVEFRLERPQDHYGTGRNADRLKPSAPTLHVSYPDLSKLVRSTEDALVSARVLVDDRMIASIAATKVYCDRPGRPGATITIEPIELPQGFLNSNRSGN